MKMTWVPKDELDLTIAKSTRKALELAQTANPDRLVTVATYTSYTILFSTTGSVLRATPTLLR